MVVSRIELANFRGIGGHLSLDLAGQRGGGPCLILGDNGSGKSSIVDALEFGLRGRLSRRGLHGEKQKREVRNLIHRGAPGVLLAMHSGEKVRRGGGITDADAPDLQVQIVPGFEFCPVVIRRHDVESFWTIPSSQRQQFFFDYLRDQGGAPLSTVAAARDIKRAELKGKLLVAREKLQRAVHEDLRIPETHAETKTFLSLLFKRYGQRPRPDGKKLPNRIYAPFVEYQQALEKAENDPSLYWGDNEQLPQQQLREILDQVSLRVSDDFARVVRKEWIRDVSISLGKEDSLDIRVALLSGKLADPVQVLNEAALDVLALLILLEVHVECSRLGQQKLLVMDDVFQSVDAVHRVRSLEHALSRLRGWQLVLTMHDRLWVELARSAMHRTGVGSPRLIEVRAAREGGVPDLRVGDSSALEVLQRLIEDRSSPEIQTSIAGRTLEQLCDRLSISLGTSVTRRRDDKYTLGDLWPGVRKALLRADIPGLRDRVNEVAEFMALRNIAGAHYNAWAESVTHREAEDFAQAVIELWSLTICQHCSAPLSIFRAQQGSRAILEFPCKCEASVSRSDASEGPEESAVLAGEAVVSAPRVSQA